MTSTTNSNDAGATRSTSTPKPLREFSEKHIDENLENEARRFENALLFNCTFKKLNGLTLERCDLNRSRFLTDDIRDALNLTLTLNCHSFDNVEFSPLLFDLFLLMAYKSKGNDAKRAALLDVIGHDRADALLRILKHLE